MNRAERRHHVKKRGDLNRLSTHKMRTNMGMRREAAKSPEQKKVDAAVKDEIQKIVQRKNIVSVPKPEVPDTYYCTACKRNHRGSSKIGVDHAHLAKTEK